MTASAPAGLSPARAAARAARDASRRLAPLPTAAKNDLLLALASRVDQRRGDIRAANARDLADAKAAGLPAPRVARLELTDRKLDQLSAGLRQVAALPDPVGLVTADRVVPSGLRVRRVRCPIGVVAMIYEARPEVTIDAFALCFKAGNACLLKGGREASASNELLTGLARDALRERGLPEAAITAVTGLDRDQLRELLTLADDIDLVIPRGGEALIRFVADHSRIPTIQHYKGVCHIFADESADPDLAERVCVSAKVSAPATCNSAECVLVHAGAARVLVPRLVAAFRAAGVEVRGCSRTAALAPGVAPASEEDWGREFLDLIVAMRVVEGPDEAIAHIARYGSNHTEAILTSDAARAADFLARVQSSCVLVNASTRFNDGFQLGLGAEIGISTSKIHAFGPMGLEELTTQRFIVEGSGQVR